MDYDPGTWDLFGDIGIITQWLNQSNSHMLPEHDESMRIMKIGEEFGEVIEAYIGYTGQNPRKGKTHGMADVLAELADVVITALCAIQYETGDAAVTRAVIASKASHIIKRAGIANEPDATSDVLIPLGEVIKSGVVPRLRRIGERD